jgi:glycosyltransferase involved in cell wall biosynthesis
MSRMSRPRSRRLLFVAGSAHLLGGLASWLDAVVPGLARKGWDPVLGLVEGPRHHRPERLIASHPHERWIRIPCATGTPEGRCRALVRALTGERPDVALSVNIPDLFPALQRVRAAGSSTRGLMTVHGIEPELYADALRFRRVVDGAVGTNRLTCRLLEVVGGIASDRVFYAPYGVARAAARPRVAEGRSRLRIGYAGRLEESQKRVGDLPLVSRALDEMGILHEWTIAGGGPDEDKLRRDMPEGRTVFLGPVAGSELPALFYGRIDALIVPSAWETGPLVAWEAMAAGVPVVASRYLGSGLEGALRDEENALLFEPADVEAAARRLARLTREPALADRLAAGGRELVRGRYSSERSIEAWERALAGVLALPPLPPAAPPPVPAATGRLERWAGPRPAETVRRLARRTGPDAGSGGEWPHAYGAGLGREEFFRQAAELDRVEAGQACSPR